MHIQCHADSVNRLVSVSVDIEKSIIKCVFLDDLSKITKRLCSIKHGPASSDCGTKPDHDEENEVSDSKSITFNAVNFSYIGTNTELCISLRARIDNKEWTVEGIYNISKDSEIDGTPEMHSGPENEWHEIVYLSLLVGFIVFLVVVTIIIVIIIVRLVLSH